MPSGTPEERQEARTRPDWRLGALGSGSDYTVFVDHLGIASLNLGYGGEDGGGIYHSIYDDFYWYTHFSDTDFQYGRALAQTAGTAVLRLADADLLPFDFTDFADTIHTYSEQLKKLLKDKQEAVRERNQEIEEGVFTATGWPHKTWLCMWMTGDNHGPPNSQEVQRLFARAKQNCRACGSASAGCRTLPTPSCARSRSCRSSAVTRRTRGSTASARCRSRPNWPMRPGRGSPRWSRSTRCWGPGACRAKRSARSSAQAYENTLLFGEHTWGPDVARYAGYSYGEEWKKNLAAGKYQFLLEGFDQKRAYARKRPRVGRAGHWERMAAWPGPWACRDAGSSCSIRFLGCAMAPSRCPWTGDAGV